MTANGNIRIADEDTYLRVERTAGRLSMSFSNDAQTWATIRPEGQDLTLQPNVRVGVFTINATNRGIIHEFTELKLTTQ